MRGLVFRRFQEAKKKLFAKMIWKQRRRWADNREPDPKAVGYIAHSPASCSCEVCGNPRKWWNQKSMQERRMDEFYRNEE